MKLSSQIHSCYAETQATLCIAAAEHA